MNISEWTYLGDGVYAIFDGYQIIITTDIYALSNRIAIDPHTYDALLDYAKRVWQSETLSAEETEA